MTAATLTRPEPRSWTAPFAAEPLLAAAGILIALSLFATLAAASLDTRLLQGEDVWLKPIKFQIALTIYLLSLAFFARWLPAGMTGRLWYRLYAALVVFSIVVELLWIGGAAMAGTASHFNVASPAMARLYQLMGLAAVVLTSASLVYGIAIWRNRATGLPPALHLAIALGLVLTFVLTVPIAGTMAQLLDHHVGVPVTDARVPVLGWSGEVGDLRAAHFLATHAMHFLPVAGLLAVALLPPRAAVAAVWIATALFVAIVAASFAGALAGLPLIRLA